MDTSYTSAVGRAIEIIGGTKATAISMGVSDPAVSAWLKNGVAPVKRCKRLEELTKGRVTVYELNPEYFGTGPTRRRNGGR